jgi:DNA adenine methylase
MKPLVKYQGGKSRELKTITALMPKEYNRIVEPFCGGAAVSFHFEKPAVLCDTNWEIINLYKSVADNQGLRRLCNEVAILKNQDHDALEQRFYDSRSTINRSFDHTLSTEWHRAINYMIVRQLCFSGMERYNSKGEFNVPFGHYKKFSCNLSYDTSGKYWEMLMRSKIIHGDFELALNEANENDFVFIDPPYLERLGYHSGDGGNDLHSRLAKILKNAPYKWMIVHSDHQFYREQYNDLNIYVEDFVYSQRFGKNKNHSKAKVQHLYITNYPVEELAHPTVTQHLDAV